MTREVCQRYLEDPDANAEHAATCESCSALMDTLAAARFDDSAPLVKPDALPLAPWEGASHRSWPLLIGGGLMLAAAAALLFAATGASPIDVLRGKLPSLETTTSMFRLAGGFIHNAPAGWQAAICVAFVIVNAIFIALLRRAPRGIDV